MGFGAVVFLSILGLASCSVINRQYDTIVVGLGAAGTTAASTLARAGKRVLALEAQGRIGGRVNTVPFGDGIVELGAEWIHGTENSRVYQAATNASIPVILGEVTMIAYNPDGSVANSELVMELVMYGFEVQGPMDHAEPVGEYVTRKLNEYIKEKYPELLNNKIFLEQVLTFLNNQVSSNEATSDWNEVTSASRFQDLGGNQQASWGRAGYKTFFELMLNTYKNGTGLPNLDIKLNTEVTNINYEADDSVTVTCKDGGVYTAGNVIVTVSLGVLKSKYKTLFTPSLPEDKVTAIENLSFGTVDKVIFQFDEIWWPKNILVFGFLWTNEAINQIDEKDRVWLGKMHSVSRPEGSSNTLTIWFNGDAARKMETLPDEEVRSKCMQVLRMFMGKDKTIPDPVAMLRSAWTLNPFTLGSYSFDSARLASPRAARAALRAPLPRVLLAGEAASDDHFSTVHGAAETGFIAANTATRLLTQYTGSL